jgi:hypothetical protein
MSFEHSEIPFVHAAEFCNKFQRSIEGFHPWDEAGLGSSRSTPMAPDQEIRFLGTPADRAQASGIRKFEHIPGTSEVQKRFPAVVINRVRFERIRLQFKGNL